MTLSSIVRSSMILGVLALGGAAEAAVYVDWTSITHGNPGTALGELPGDVDVTLINGSLRTDRPSYITSPPNPSGGFAWPGGGNFFTPAGVLSEYIRLNDRQTTITFSKPVTDIFFNFEFLFVPESPLVFDATPTLLSSNGAVTVSGNTVTPNGAHGTLKFSGTFTSLSFNSPVPTNNSWYLQIGVEQVAQETEGVPEPSTYGLALLGLVGLGWVAWRRKH